MIDLRSDTVTKPSKEMLEKVLEAELGDDEYKEDPTVNSFEDYCSELMGFESGLFVTSGLMGNQISLLNLKLQKDHFRIPLGQSSTLQDCLQ